MLLAILSVPFKCPPAPYEAAMLLHAKWYGAASATVPASM